MDIFDESLELLRNLSFCVVDLETTGGNQSYDKIIEVGLVKIERLEIVQELGFLINPEMTIPDFIQKLTSINQHQILEAPKIEDVMDQILHFMGNSILVAHNSSFDIPFFNSVLHRMQRGHLHNKNLCTNLLTRNLIPDIINSNLSYLTKLFHLPHGKAHRAIEDARATAHLLLFFLHILSEKKIKKVNQIYYPRKKFELDNCHFKTLKELESNEEHLSKIPIPMLITIKGEEGVLLDILPYDSFINHKKSFHHKLNQHSWQMITIKLISSPLQGIFYLYKNFQKIPNQLMIKNIMFVAEALGLQDFQELVKNFMMKENYAEDIEKYLKEIRNKIFILPHIVPQQFIAFHLESYFLKKDFIFRFPTHQQKFNQFLSKIEKRFVQNTHPSLEKKRTENQIHFRPILLIHQYLQKIPSPYLHIIDLNNLRNNNSEQKKVLDYLKSYEQHNIFQFPTYHL
jgi:DNA polymerase-3 subunit epsilon